MIRPQARLMRAFTLVGRPALLLLAGATFVSARDTSLNLRQTEVLRELNNIRVHHRATGSVQGLWPQGAP